MCVTNFRSISFFRLVRRRETKGRKYMYTSENKNILYGLFASRDFEKKFLDMVYRSPEFQVPIVVLFVRGSRTNQQTQLYGQIKENTLSLCHVYFFLIRCIKSL